MFIIYFILKVILTSIIISSFIIGETFIRNFCKLHIKTRKEILEEYSESCNLNYILAKSNLCYYSYKLFAWSFKILILTFIVYLIIKIWI